MTDKLSKAYSDGVQVGLQVLSAYKQVIDVDADLHHITPEKVIEDLRLLFDGPPCDLREGLAHVLAQFVIVCLEGCVPDPDAWDALRELRDPLWFKD